MKQTDASQFKIVDKVPNVDLCSKKTARPCAVHQGLLKTLYLRSTQGRQGYLPKHLLNSQSQ